REIGVCALPDSGERAAIRIRRLERQAVGELLPYSRLQGIIFVALKASPNIVAGCISQQGYAKDRILRGRGCYAVGNIGGIESVVPAIDRMRGACKLCGVEADTIGRRRLELVITVRTCIADLQHEVVEELILDVQVVLKHSRCGKVL